MILARIAAAALAAALLAGWTVPAAACACDKEARIKKYGTLRLINEPAPPATPSTTAPGAPSMAPPPVPVPAPATVPGS